MGILQRVLRRTTARRSFEGALPASRRGIRSFGPTGPETLAAAAPLRSRARHAAANNAWIANGVAAIVGEAVGAGIEATSAHPDSDQRPTLDAAFDSFAAEADAEGRTDLRGLVAQMVRACVIDGEAFTMIEEDADGLRVRLIPAEMVDESLTRELAGGGYIVAGIEFDARGRRVAYHVLPHRPTDHFPTAAQPVRIPAGGMLHLTCPPRLPHS